MENLRVGNVRTQVGFSLFTDFVDFKAFQPGPPTTGQPGQIILDSAVEVSKGGKRLTQ